MPEDLHAENLLFCEYKSQFNREINFNDLEALAEELTRLGFELPSEDDEESE